MGLRPGYGMGAGYNHFSRLPHFCPGIAVIAAATNGGNTRSTQQAADGREKQERLFVSDLASKNHWRWSDVEWQELKSLPGVMDLSATQVTKRCSCLGGRDGMYIVYVYVYIYVLD
jgi:hypothetical protein